MERMNRTKFDCISVRFKGLNFSVISSDNLSIVDNIISTLGIRLNRLCKYDCDIVFEIIDGKLYLTEVICSKNITKKLFGIEPTLSQERSKYLFKVLCQDVELVLVYEKNALFDERAPFYYPYFFKHIYFFETDSVIECTLTLKKLMELDFSPYIDFENPSLAENIYKDLIKDCDSFFEKVLPFEDYYDFKIESRKEIDGVFNS